MLDGESLSLNRLDKWGSASTTRGALDLIEPPAANEPSTVPPINGHGQEDHLCLTLHRLSEIVDDGAQITFYVEPIDENLNLKYFAFVAGKDNQPIEQMVKEIMFYRAAKIKLDEFKKSREFCDDAGKGNDYFIAPSQSEPKVLCKGMSMQVTLRRKGAKYLMRLSIGEEEKICNVVESPGKPFHLGFYCSREQIILFTPRDVALYTELSMRFEAKKQAAGSDLRDPMGLRRTCMCLDQRRLWKILPCYHAVCTDCFSRMDSGKEHLDDLVCPFCRHGNDDSKQEVRIPLRGDSDSRTIMLDPKSLEIRKRIKTESKDGRSYDTFCGFDQCMVRDALMLPCGCITCHPSDPSGNKKTSKFPCPICAKPVMEVWDIKG